MGQLISRALRRFTQSRDQLANQQYDATTGTAASERRTTDNVSAQSKVQSIPVGQSIDSAEFAVYKDAKSERDELLIENNKGDNGNKIDHANKQLTNPELDDSDHQAKQPEVEEAVIKIQALVRGHLTRKALRADAQQQGFSSPPLNALGQSQFDDESLMKNPSRVGSPRPHLESIAEDAETAIQNSPLRTQSSRGSSRLRLSPMNESSSRNESRDSMSPVPSEANASIDLNCDTPQSASIDISDHNIKPTDRIASVLHHKTDSPQPSPSISIREDIIDVGTEPTFDQVILNAPPSSPTNANASLGSPDSAESAAAIRIQSAFRGYKTRKHSPYRRRSPSGNTSPPSNGVAIERNAFRQHDAIINDDNGDFEIINEQVQSQAQSSSINSKDVDEGIEEDDEALRAASETGRRMSRQRQRDAVLANDDLNQIEDKGLSGQSIDSKSTLDHALQTTTSVEEFTTTEDSTVREITNNPSLPSSFRELEESGAALASVDEHLPESLNQSASGVQEINFAPVVDVSSHTNETSQIGGGLTSNIVSLANETEGSIQLAELPAYQRPSIGGQSFEMDTDSSNLGAALSLNEDTPEQQQQHQSISTQFDSNVNFDQSTQGTNDFTFDDDKSFGANLISEELESEERKLVDEMNEITGGVCTMDEGRQQLERQQEAAAAALVDSILDEDEQRVIELESDDIERRDPRGSASKERAKSPQIETEQSSFNVNHSGELVRIDAPAGQTINESSTAPHEGVGAINDSASPILYSSNGGSSGSGEDDAGCSSDADRDASNKPGKPKHQRQAEHDAGGSHQAGGSKANKRRNRNKKKGNKK